MPGKEVRQMDYGDVVRRGWQIVWGHKYLILLGFLASLGAGGTGRSTVSYNVGLEDLPPGFADRLEPFLLAVGAYLAVAMCVALLAAVVFWLVRLTSQAGLISASSRFDAGASMTLGEAFSAGLGKLGRMVGINLILFGPFALAAVLAVGLLLALGGMAALAETQGGLGNVEAVFGTLGVLGICIAVLTCFALPVFLVVSFIYPFAQRGAVLQDLGVVASVSHGFKVLKENVVHILLLSLVFLVIGAVFAAVSAAVLVPLGFLTFFPALVNLLETGTPTAGNVLLLACGGALFALIAAVINALLAAFRSATFTVAYREFVGKVGP
jgi:hypothetical protein